MVKRMIDQSLMDPEVQRCPYDFEAKLRKECPVYEMPETGFYVISQFEHIRKVFSQPGLFASNIDLRAFKPGGPTPEVAEIYEERGWPPVDMLIAADPPDHTRHRALVKQAFSPRQVARMEALVNEVIAGVIDSFIDSGKVEFVEEVAARVPLSVIADLLGLPREDIPMFRRVTRARVDAMGLMVSREREIECAESSVEFQHYLVARLEERRKMPRNDLMSDLIHAEVDGVAPLNTQELLWIVEQLTVAGNQTTKDAMASGMWMLVQNPALMEELRGHPDRMRAFVEETVRLESPVQGLSRITTANTELGGVPIPKGSIVLMRLGSGGRDENQFDDAAAIDLTRRNPVAHLGFGAGIHFCLGASLARLELASTLRAILERLNDIEVDPEHPEPLYNPNLFVRSLEELCLVFSPRKV